MDEIIPGECCTVIAKNSDGSIVGFLPMYVIDGPYGLVYNSQPFFGSYGDIQTTDEEARKLLISEWNKLVTASNVCSGTIIENPQQERKNLASEKEIVYNSEDMRIGQCTDLSICAGDIENIWPLLHVKTRNALRKGLNQGFVVNSDCAEWNFLKEKHFESMKRMDGVSKPEQFFSKVPKYFAPEEQFRIWTAYSDGKPVSSILLFYWGDSVEYFLPVVDLEFRSLQPLSCVIFEAMKDAVQRGFTVWNWGGTWQSQKGVYRFKSRWGSTNQEYRYFTQLNNFAIKEKDKKELFSFYPNYFLYPFDN